MQLLEPASQAAGALGEFPGAFFAPRMVEAAWVAALRPDELDELRRLADEGRPALTERLKTLGFTKLGQRVRIEQIIARGATTPQGACAGGERAHAERCESGRAAEFSASASFVGARPGCAYKLGPHGLGYYRDGARKVRAGEPRAESERKFAGNLSWLSEPAAEHSGAQHDAPAAPSSSLADAAAAPAAPPPPANLDGEARRNGARREGGLSERRRAALEIASRPYAPVLREGRHAEVGDAVKVHERRGAVTPNVHTPPSYGPPSPS